MTLDDRQFWALEMAGIIVSVYFPEKVSEDTPVLTESQDDLQATVTLSENQPKTILPIRNSRDLKLDASVGPIS